MIAQHLPRCLVRSTAPSHFKFALARACHGPSRSLPQQSRHQLLVALVHLDTFVSPAPRSPATERDGPSQHHHAAGCSTRSTTNAPHASQAWGGLCSTASACAEEANRTTSRSAQESHLLARSWATGGLGGRPASDETRAGKGLAEGHAAVQAAAGLPQPLPPLHGGNWMPRPILQPSSGSGGPVPSPRDRASASAPSQLRSIFSSPSLLAASQSNTVVPGSGATCFSRAGAACGWRFNRGSSTGTSSGTSSSSSTSSGTSNCGSSSGLQPGGVRSLSTVAGQPIRLSTEEGAEPSTTAQLGTKARRTAAGGKSTGSSQKPDGPALFKVLNQSIALELGEQYCLEPSWLTASLRKELVARPSAATREKVGGLKEAVGREAAGALLRCCPHLLGHVRPADVPARLDALAVALKIDRSAVLLLCGKSRRAPQVLICDPDTAHDRVAALSSVIQMAPGEKLAALLFKYPKVLRVNPGVVQSRAAALMGTLGVDSARVAKLFQTNPGCLHAPPSTVEAAMEALRLALDVPKEKAVQLCLRISKLLEKDAGSLTDIVNALQQHLNFQWEDFEEHLVMLTIPASVVGPRLEALPAALGISRDDALLLLKDVPRFLMIESKSLEASWKELLQFERLRPEWSKQLAAMQAQTLCTLCTIPSARIRQRVAAVMALNPDSKHLPALTVLRRGSDGGFAALLARVQSKEFKSKWRGPKHLLDSSVQLRHPSLWRQLCGGANGP